MDHIAIALTDDAALRVYAAITTDTVKEAQILHKSYPVATAALGRTLTAGAIMGAMLKGDKGSITIQIKGDGPLGTIIVVSDSKSNVRGYVSNPDISMPPRADGKLDVGGGVGKNGFVNIVRDLGMGKPYAGHIELVSGEIAEDLTKYFAVSEQIPTAMALGVLVDTDGSVAASGGFIVQLMPGFGYGDDEIITRLEETIKTLPSVTKMIADGADGEGIINALLEGTPYNVLEKRGVRYKCGCSYKRVERALISIGEKDLLSLIEDGIDAVIDCNFCDKKYVFSVEHLKALLRKCRKS
ncbi:MAG: 33 kDa chaperonin [Firmicutes bacterium ADurb.Bin193]|nr:MAG: 33 kDa chaperonin [Firmicutes bacterium ADurb.Bin193]